MTNVQERAASTGIALAQQTQQQHYNQAALGTSRSAMLQRGDAIRRAGPQQWLPVDVPPGQGIIGPPLGILSQLVSIIQQLLSMLGMGGMFGSLFGNASQMPGTYFQNASASSTGDPHLSFNGTDGSGATRQARFDSMTGHGDLLDSDSFAGGYQISTSVTQPGANGVTYNQQATISTGFGSTQISLDKNGNATVMQNGQTLSLADGQSYDLGSGQMVTRNANGTVVVRDDNGMGGSVTTTLSANGSGVDVSTQAANVDLGGDLLNQRPLPVMQPM